MNKRWMIFGGPRDVLEMMNARKKTLEKDQVKFMDEMKVAQDEFKQTIDNLERTIQNFHQHSKLDNHADIALDVKSINEQIIRYQDDARKFVMQETLFDIMDTTDYSKLNQMSRDFQPYSNLWLTANKWFTDQVGWLNGEWETVDAVSAEKFVEESVKTLQ